MSHLIAHAKALRSLAEAFAFEGNDTLQEPQSSILIKMSAAYSRAAADIERKAKAEASGPEFADRPRK